VQAFDGLVQCGRPATQSRTEKPRTAFEDIQDRDERALRTRDAFERVTYLLKALRVG